MKKVLISALMALTVLSANAQEKKSWINNVKLSGYGQLQYQASDQEGAEKNSFNLRIMRVSLDGKIADDFAWKAQFQMNGNTSTLASSLRLVDLFAEWQKYEAFRVKIGQYKRPFTFENPMNPIDQGFMSYGQNVTKLAGFSDRAGGHASNGRDIGLQFQGDFAKNANGRNLVHYQVGVFNGQGINVQDVDQRKDLIGGVWVMPVAGMRLGVFGWEGTYARKGSWTDANGNTQSGTVSLPQHRYAISGEYKVNDWTFRSEYIHSTGYAFKTAMVNTNDASSKDCTVNYAQGNKSDGVYALVIAPIVKNKAHIKARYDMYRPSAEWATSKTQYELSADYLFHKNFQLNVEYARVNDRSQVIDGKRNYNVFDFEVDFRF